MRPFLRRYKYYLMAPVVLLVLLAVLLLFASFGKENAPFVYQIF